MADRRKIGAPKILGPVPSHCLNRLIAGPVHGHMSKELCNLTDLQILDFSYNNFNGSIPTCIGNLMGMSALPFDKTITITVIFSYMESYATVRKQKMVEYNTILGFVQSLDLSNNNFVGEIPEGITNLSRLQSLNFSHNFFTGKIPKEINGLQNLESLDLSHNCLFGEIPQSMSSMNFLNDLNLSYNNLSGQIPIGTQLQSMDLSSFTGNKLSGPPLIDDCNDKEATPPSNGEGKEDRGDKTEAMDWFYIYLSLTAGFVVGFWFAVGPLAFNAQWRRTYFNLLDLLWDKIWVWYHVNVVRFVRNYGW